MDELIVPGPQILRGQIDVSGAKNGVLPLIVCSMLTDQEVVLSNVPNLSDVHTMGDLMSSYGADVNFDQKDKQLRIKCFDINHIDASDIKKIRASIWLLAPLLIRLGKVKMPMPGGCGIGDKKSGARQIDLHLDLLASMGASIEVRDGYVLAEIKEKFKATDFTFKKVSVGATINAILASVLADGETTLRECAIEPEISEMCHLLVKMGAKIQGIGTRELIISGVTSLQGAQQKVIPDRIEAGTYLIMAAATKGYVKVNGINYNILQSLCDALQLAGNKMEFHDNSISLYSGQQIHPVDITTTPFPGFVTDLQAQFMSLMCLSSGTSFISEKIYDNRFMHVKELNKIGANISIEGPTAKVIGVKELNAASVRASDLRASVCLVLAGLSAKGVTRIADIHHLKRGYEDLDLKLAKCGVQVEWSNSVDVISETAAGLV